MKTAKKQKKSDTSSKQDDDLFALPKKDYKKIKDELDHCSRPLYFFHDDADGVSSFLQFYRYKREGRGIIIKSTPVVDRKFLRKATEYSPDKIFVLDIADVDQDFIDSVDCPIIWVDHHGPYERERIKYFNPRNYRQDSNPPVSYLVSKALDEPEDAWIAMAGMVGDWFLPPDHKEFSKLYPDLLPKNIRKPEDALFRTGIGKMAEIFNFMLKGTSSEALKYVKVMTRIKHYDEIFSQTTSQGNFIYKRYTYVRSLYEELLKRAKKKAGKSSLLLFEYTESNMSFTGELSNELLFLYPEKVILIAREKDGEMKCSLRSAKFILPPILESVLAGLDGRGGGHEHACGAVVSKSDFKEFLKRLRSELKKQK